MKYRTGDFIPAGQYVQVITFNQVGVVEGFELWTPDEFAVKLVPLERQGGTEAGK